ncbi:DUF4041 domain-containing protein [Paractinoplanes durhamensis]|uniref:DUF4041 domain-containing protein n=1 Tax=Paractinoplanes durhamensis TaxID=113563 RepID=UPI001EF3BA11|nr:DUF4041 domain-containing protein [Actinoplanes durhamensis]
MPTYRFNTPPGWPTPPADWTPPEGWQPDPSWPPAPQGWPWWLPEAPAAPPPDSNRPVVPVVHGLPETAAPPAPADTARGIFGGKRRLEEENEDLRRQLTAVMGLDPSAVSAEAFRLRDQLQRLRAEQATLEGQLTHQRAELVRTSEEAELQEVGIYRYQHPLADAVAYKGQLADLTDQIKAMARSGTAVEAGNGWTVNGSTVEGRKMVNEYTKLMLRAYNAEADGCVARVRPHRLHTTVERLDKVAHTIARLGKTMGIRVSPRYHQLRIHEIGMTADYRAKLDEEKERVREEREHQREERAALAELEREKARLAKEQSHYEAALAKLHAKGDAAAVSEMEAKLAEIGDAIAGVEAREANTRAGYVYVISNYGAFGPDMVKIGMTRRLDPEDRVRELGDASVPFRFDTHALIFSHDAVGLEGQLHAALAAQRVNKVNVRREFFYANPAQVRDLLQKIAGQHLLAYHETPEALEWRSSGATLHDTQPPSTTTMI